MKNAKVKDSATTSLPTYLMQKAKVNVSSSLGLGHPAGDPEGEAAPPPPGLVFLLFLFLKRVGPEAMKHD